MFSESCSDKCGLSNISRDSDYVSQYYDNWADAYEEDLTKWRYDAPVQAALMLRGELPQAAVVLDAGCGTGLCGKAMRSAGFAKIDGIDISHRSLKIANRSKAYRLLCAVNMQQQPIPIDSDTYDGLACVGVMTYLPDSSGTLREFGRMVKSGGTIVVTQRSDLLIERDFEGELEALCTEGVFNHVQVSESRPYLPENEEFADKLLVNYVRCRVA
jgi:predicted TPR repeat methyltransferase